jgi:hypothetical protein
MKMVLIIIEELVCLNQIPHFLSTLLAVSGPEPENHIVPIII